MHLFYEMLKRDQMFRDDFEAEFGQNPCKDFAVRSRYVCDCGEAVSGEFHVCPFKQDICGDSETVCNCCSHCETSCADDI